MRCGIGYDVHRLVEGRRLVLGGVEIPYEKGLLGHGDADVLAHAIADAMLGAAHLGDIGRHFPDSDPQWKDADSMHILRQVGILVAREKNLGVENIDSVVIAQRPMLASYIPEMEKRIAAALALYPDQVNIKATTTEQLGWEGAGEGIAAQAVCLLKSLR